MAIKLYLFLAICLVVVGFTFIASEHHKNFLEQSAAVIFPCPTGKDASYSYFDSSAPLNNNILTSALSELAKCSGLSNLISLDFQISNSDITKINMFQQVLDKTNNLQELTLDFYNNQINDAGITEFKNMLSILPKLQSLLIDLSFNQLTSLTGFADAFSKSVSLQVLNLKFGGESLNSLAGLTGILNPLKNLQEFTLFGYDSTITEIPVLNTNQQSTKNYNSITFVFSYNSALSNINNIATLLKLISQPIDSLQLNFDNCYISDISSVLQATNKISVTNQIYISFFQNSILSLTGIENAFQSTTSVKSLYLDFSRNQIQNSYDFWAFINRISVSQTLDISFTYNQFKTLTGIEKAFENQKQLKSFKLSIDNNQLTDVSQLGKSLVNLTNIQKFHLVLSDNQINNSVNDLTLDIYYSVAANRAFCPFNVNLLSNSFQSDQYTMQTIASTSQKIQNLQQYATCSPTSYIFNY